MSLEREFTCPLPNGIHARPASALEEFARKFHSDVTVFNNRTQSTANSKSVLSIVGADIRLNDRCVFRISGTDEHAAREELTAFLRDVFPNCDEPLKNEAAQHTSSSANNTSYLSPCLKHAGAVIHRGISVVPGIARGCGVIAGKGWDPDALSIKAASEPAHEWRKLETALEKLALDCDRRIATLVAGIEADLLKVHRSIARDFEFQKLLQQETLVHSHTAARALARSEKHFSDVLSATGNALLRERALDIQDVCAQLARQIYGDAVGGAKLELREDAIVFAESLTPGQFLALDRRFLKGVVLAHASTTSHTAILGRAFNIPMLAGVENFPRANFAGQEAVLDAGAGALVTNLTDAARRYYVIEQKRISDRRARLQQLAMLPASTLDGHRIEIAANIATSDEAVSAFENGAEGIGLFRTEMLFLDRKTPPTEDEQFESYRAVLAAAVSENTNRTVVIRTLDVGGDKQLDYLKLPAEENPFLGCRAVRIYPGSESLFRTQIRALVRASAHGKLNVMVPMIAVISEARWVKKIIAEEQQKCVVEKIPFDSMMRVGAMVEVPAAAFTLEALSREFDFFSIGSNDLLQYFMATDRMNAQLALLYDPLQPAFLRLLNQIVTTVHAHKKEISLCGEIDAQAKILPLLVGLGLDKISASVPLIARLKSDMAALNFTECRALTEEALRAAETSEVAALLEQFSSRNIPPLLDEEFIIIDSDATTKEEAIKQAIDRMYVLGRTDNARAVEEAIWLREAKYTTGFGHGFAIPHCKSAAVRFSTLVLLKTRTPLAWNSLDGQPVRVVILLAIRDGDGANAHMKVLSRLARKIMDDDFRAELEREQSPASLLTIFQQIL